MKKPFRVLAYVDLLGYLSHPILVGDFWFYWQAELAAYAANAVGGFSCEILERTSSA